MQNSLKNNAKIKYNPYIPKIEFFYWNSENEDWETPSCESPFLEPELINATIQNKAYDIIQNMQSIYNPGNVGLDLYFEGTSEDMEYFTQIVKEYYSSYNINIIPGEMSLLSAPYVKEQIENIFTNMGEKFSDYYDKQDKDDEISVFLSKYTETVRPTIPICVMGNYSAGKSAFINGLLGKELLPSASDPTTAKTYMVSSGSKYEIKFVYKANENDYKTIQLLFIDDKLKITKSGELEIVKKLNEIKKYKTIEKRMYEALSIINDFDMKNNKNLPEDKKTWRVSDLIEVTIPLQSSVLPFDKYDFIIYDTPGSNSASNTDHTKILQDAMEGQTNGLPIFVTEPDSMDSIDNEKLINTIDELGGALDKGNLIIIVNKSDGKDPNTLAKKKEDFDGLAISKLNPAGVFFVSSVMGLGFKKMMLGDTVEVEDEDDNGDPIVIVKPKWIDLNYSSVFDDCKKKFRRKNNPLALYSYNILPEHQFALYSKTTVSDEYYAYRNSGLYAVETVIKDFAMNYSLYNKCRNASMYLSKALAILKNKIDVLLKDQAELQSMIESDMSDKEKRVLNKLSDECEKRKKQYIGEYSAVIYNEHTSFQKALGESITRNITEIWEESKGKSERKKWVTIKVNKLLKEKVYNYWNQIKNASLSFWKKKETEFKQALISIIVESPELTKEQQELLKNEILSISSTPDYAFEASLESKDIVGTFLFIKILKGEKASEKFMTEFKVGSGLANQTVTDQTIVAFDWMVKKVSERFTKLVAKHNPQIIELTHRLNECRDKIEFMNNQQCQIKNDISEVRQLTDYRLSE